MKQRIIFILVLITLAFLFAPFAHRVFQAILIEPISYYWWWIRQIIHVIPEIFYWFFFIACFGGVAVIFLLREMFNQRIRKEDRNLQKGPVEFLTGYILRSNNSNYFKWVIANRLANITLNILGQKNGADEKPRDFSHIDQEVPPAISAYLETGLLNSFMDFRQKRKIFAKSRETPFNLDIHEVLDWVESQMEQ